jgi:bacillolysin
MKKTFKPGLKLILLIALLASFGFNSPEKIVSNQTFQLSNYLKTKDGNWLYFKSGLKMPISDFFEKSKSSLEFSSDIGIRTEKTDTDKLGMIHYLLRLTSNKIVIDDAWYTAHYSKDGDLLVFEGSFQGKLPGIEKPRVSKENAVLIAKDAFTSSRVLPPDYFKILKEDIDGATQENKRIISELVYFKPGKQDYMLTYKVSVATTIEEPMQEFYIDAQTGKIIKSSQIVFNSQGTVNTLYNGSRNFQTTWRGSGYNYYYLLDLSKSTPIETRNSQPRYTGECQPHGFGGLDVVDNGTSNTWSSGNYYNAASAHWAVQEAYNVFLDHFGRTYGTFTQSGCEIRVENDYFWRLEHPSGAWVGLTTYYYPDGMFDYIHAGKFTGSQTYDVGLDVLGHEFTHGCIYRSRGNTEDPDYGTEAGALTESLCDIFGEVIEYYTLGDNDYVAGTNHFSQYRRDFADPESDSIYSPFGPSNLTGEFCSPTIVNLDFLSLAPSSWQGTNWYYNIYSKSRYNHTNCFVQDHWFYLLAEGGTQNGVTVTGIGIEKAAEITYYNLAYYFNSSSTFASMRNASVLFAKYLYGECSNEAQQVIKAWDAVGVTGQLDFTIGGPGYVCSGGSEFTVNCLPTGATVEWYKSGNITMVSAQGSIPGVFEPDEDGTGGYIGAIITYDNVQYWATQKDVRVGTPYAPTTMRVWDPLCANSEIQLEIEDPGNPASTYYDWDLSTYNNAYIYDHQGTLYASIYSYDTGEITMIVTAQNGCGSSEPLFSDPLYIDYCYFKIDLYPNPATSDLKIKLSEDPSVPAIVEIYNSQVIKMVSTSFKSRETTLNISKLPKGVYYVTVKIKEKISTVKFIKE